jgi:hypothetical protein
MTAAMHANSCSNVLSTTIGIFHWSKGRLQLLLVNRVDRYRYLHIVPPPPSKTICSDFSFSQGQSFCPSGDKALYCLRHCMFLNWLTRLDDGAYLPEECASHWQVTSSLGYLRSHDCNFRSPLMKTLDWSVETLGPDYNSTGLCNHLFKPEKRAKHDKYS